MEESKTVKEEIETEGEDGYSVVKVFDGDHETEVMIKKADREITVSGSTEVADHTNSIDNISKNVTVVEEDNDSCEKLLEGSNDIELPALISSIEMEVTSNPVVDIEHIEDVEEGLNEESEDSKDSSLVDTSILDKSSELENNITTEELSEKETAFVSSTPGVDIKHSENMEEGINEGNKDSSSADASILENSPDMENNMTLKLLEMETNDVTSVSLIPAPVVDVSDSDVFQANPNVETKMQHEIIEDGESDVVSLGPRLERAISLSEEIEEQNLPDGMQDLIIENGIESDVNEAEADFPPTEAATNLSIDSEAQASEIVEYGSESDLTQLMTVSAQLEVESILDEETGTGTMEEDDGAESLKVLNNMSEDLIMGSKRTDVDENVQSDEILEASVPESTVPESTESATKSQQILMTNFVLSSGAALLPHPSKVLTGGEDAYFIAGQTWLGVADGVGQWSLEGTSPGVYAQELIKTCERLVSDCNGDSVKNPAELFNRSIAETHSSGASTVSIAQFDGQALHVANVGDSGFIVLRHGAVYKRSSPMHHVFHFPLLIERGDEPSSLAEFYKIDLEEDDVIITASDGLLDNLYDQEISSIVMKSLAADKKLEEIAELLATKAQEIGRSASTRSPFADDAKAAGFAEYTGGKLDDVAVIVSVEISKWRHHEELFCAIADLKVDIFWKQ
ncbi:hypothetical protein DH2020_011111 [Rehmannia glutinosa]|uniref:Protein phosphatase n=1 Tax=Rehmannia glutinosa TaxID=99300 RepID=A0ABR0XCD6_REHGL